MAEKQISVMSDKEIAESLAAVGSIGEWAVKRLAQLERSLLIAQELAMTNGSEAQRLRAALDSRGLQCYRLRAQVRKLRAKLDEVLSQYEQVCADNSVMGWPAMVVSARAVLNDVTDTE